MCDLGERDQVAQGSLPLPGIGVQVRDLHFTGSDAIQHLDVYADRTQRPVQGGAIHGLPA